MSNIERRVEQLEMKNGRTVDGRDPMIVELCKIVAESKGEPFGIERVPRGLTVRELLDAVADSPRSRGSLIIAAESERRGRYAGS